MSESLPDFVGMTVLPKPPPPTESTKNTYKELWNKLSWALGSSYQVKYTGSTQIRSLARRLVLIVVANENQFLE